MDQIQIAWLSGLWDGEGSVGSHKSSPTNVGPKLQMSMTCEPTIRHAIAVLHYIGVTALGYTYQERESHHKDAHYIRVNRTTDALLVAQALHPYSITKARQWVLITEMCNLKIARRRVMPDGRLARGGIPAEPITPREFEIHEELRSIHYRAKPN